MTGSWKDLSNEEGKGRTYMLDDFQECSGRRTTSTASTSTPRTRTSSRSPRDAAGPEAEPARLLDQRHHEPVERQRLDPPRVERRRRQRPQPGRESRGLQVPDEQGGYPGRLRHDGDPGQRRSTPARRCCSSTGCSTRRTPPRTSPTSATRCRTTAPRTTFDELVKDDPSIDVTTEDLEKRRPVRQPHPPRRTALWTASGPRSRRPRRSIGRCGGRDCYRRAFLLPRRACWLLALLRGPAGHPRRAVVRHDRRARQRRLRLEPAELRRRLRPDVRSRCSLRSVGLRVRARSALPADRLPGRLLHRPLRRPLQERADRARRAAVLRQLPGADVRLGGAALRRGRSSTACSGTGIPTDPVPQHPRAR